MKQETPTTITTKKAESKSSVVSLSTTPPSRVRASSTKTKDSVKPEIVNGYGHGYGGVSVSPSPKPTRPKSVPGGDTHNNNNIRKTTTTRLRSHALNKPKSGKDLPPPVIVVGSQNVRELEKFKAPVSHRSANRPVVVEQFARPTTRQRLTDPNWSKKRNEEGDYLVDGKNNKNKHQQQEKIDPDVDHNNEHLMMIRNLQSEVLELKAELDKTHSLNVELQSQNTKLFQDLAAAQSKITALTTRDQSVAEYQLEHSKVKKEATNETITTNTPSAAVVLPLLRTADVQRRTPECSSAPPPPPPPPPPPARSAATEKASAVVELYHSLARRHGNKDPLVRGNHCKPTVSSAHYSIVGEIQNRSAHLSAIKLDIATKGDFIDGLIQKVLAAAYSDIEDVLKFMDWLDNELSSLADERAVLKHFKWPEKKADAMREAAIEYRNLKLLESEVSSYKDDATILCEVALKKIVGLLDKSERSTQRLIKLRNSVMLSYQDHKIPTDWMLESGIVSKIKQASIMLAKMYLKRVMVELESIRYSERESTQEVLLLQGVHFAYRAHQFSGGLDSETLCAFEEIRQRVPGHLRGYPELFAGIPTS